MRAPSPAATVRETIHPETIHPEQMHRGLRRLVMIRHRVARTPFVMAIGTRSVTAVRSEVNGPAAVGAAAAADAATAVVRNRSAHRARRSPPQSNRKHCRARSYRPSAPRRSARD